MLSIKHESIQEYLNDHFFILFFFPPQLQTSSKMHAYVMTNRKLRQGKEQNDPHPCVADYPNNLSFKDYFAFTWMPTLIYQTRYPRLEGPIDWRYALVSWKFYSLLTAFFFFLSSLLKRRVAKHFLDFGMSVAYAFTILDRFISPQLEQACSQSYFDLLLTFFALCVPGIFLALLTFFGLLHSWFSAWAEITR